MKLCIVILTATVCCVSGGYPKLQDFFQVPDVSTLPVISTVASTLSTQNLTDFFASLSEISGVDDLLNAGSDVAADSLAMEIELWARLGIRSDALDTTLKKLALPNELRRTDWNLFTGFQTFAVCTICKAGVKAAITLRKAGIPAKTITDTMATLCWLLNIQTREVCRGLIDLNAPVILYIVDNRPSLTAQDVCGVVLQNQRCSTISKSFKWSVAMDPGPPKQLNVQRSGETKKLVQITDIHYDPYYEPYGNADCPEPTCCRKGQNGSTWLGRKLAGYWGDYNNCDSPWEAVIDTLNQIKYTHQDIDYIYFTGDIIDHGVWETTQMGNAESLIKIYNMIQITFPTMKVYPILGNHEPHPLNLFAPSSVTDPKLSTQWVYKLLADLWIGFGWLPESTRSTILRGGFYTITPKPGFRIIVLNNNVCYTYNWWVLYDPQDPDKQLKWLADTLLRAENAGEVVHILAHIPPGDITCQHTWSREYRKIVNRFAHIITGQFNGHTHLDELRLIYSTDEPPTIINVAWNGGSITPFSNLNPNYKVYHVDSNTHHVEDYDAWIYNLTQANQMPSGRPDWYKSYSFKSEYGLTDLSLESLNQWAIGLSKNTYQLQTYYRHYVKKADPSLSKGCDRTCSKRLLCEMVTWPVEPRSLCSTSMGF